MKLVKIFMLGMVLTLGVAACSSTSTTSSDGSTDGTTTDADSGDTGSGDADSDDSGGDGGSGGEVSGGSSDYCQQVAKIFEENASAFDQINEVEGGAGTDLADVEAAYKKNMGVLADLMDQIADISPNEIKGDVEAIADGYRSAADAGVTGSATAFNNEAFLQSTQDWGQYMAQSCSLTDIPVPGL